jgi:AcrR family transcriptional regulator
VAAASTAPNRSGTGRRYGRQTPAERQAERRGRIIDAAVDAFGTRGYLHTSIEQLCSAAGISTRNFYDEFPSREGLLATLHDMLNERAFDGAVAALAEMDASDLAARATSGVRAYLSVMTSDPRWARIALVESVGVSAEMEQHRRQALARFAALIEAEADRLAAAGVAARRDYSLTAIAAVGAINGLVSTWTTPSEWDAVFDAVTAEAARVIVALVQFH